MADSDITIEILRDIRDGIRTLDKKLVTTNERIDDTNARLDALTLGVTSRLDAVDRAITELATQMFMLGRYVKNRVAAEIDDLKLRLAKLESGN